MSNQTTCKGFKKLLFFYFACVVKYRKYLFVFEEEAAAVRSAGAASCKTRVGRCNSRRRELEKVSQ